MGTRGLVGRGLVAVFLVGLLFAGLAASAAVAAPGDPDPSYSGGASVLAAGPVPAYAVATTADGRIVAAGGDDGFAVTRLLPDGRSDSSFGSGGTASVPFAAGGERGHGRAVVVQPDGKVVVAGSAVPVWDNTPVLDFALARLLPDGRLDPGFGSGGRVTTPFGADDARAYALLAQPDGKLVVCGVGTGGDGRRGAAVARYLPDGSLDRSFGAAGKTVMAPPSLAIACFGIGLGQTGKLTIGGTALGAPDFTEHLVAARLLPDGQADPSFGTGGVSARGPTTVFTSSLPSSALQPDGRVVVAGSHEVGTLQGFGLVRFNPDGSIDRSFGSDGSVLTAFPAADAAAAATVLQGNGKLVVGGTATARSDGHRAFALARYLSDGAADQAFGHLGLVQSSLGRPYADLRALALQQDGKLIAAGQAGYEASPGLATARFLADPVAPPNFGGVAPETGTATAPSNPDTTTGGAATRPAQAPLIASLTIAHTHLATLLKRGLRLRVRCSLSCTVTVVVTISRRTARRAGLAKAHGQFAVGRTRAALGPGERTLIVRVTRAARTRLKALRRLTVMVHSMTASTTGARSVRVTKATFTR